jgi:hypothetical protein
MLSVTAGDENVITSEHVMLSGTAGCVEWYLRWRWPRAVASSNVTKPWLLSMLVYRDTTLLYGYCYVG